MKLTWANADRIKLKMCGTNMYDHYGLCLKRGIIVNINVYYETDIVSEKRVRKYNTVDCHFRTCTKEMIAMVDKFIELNHLNQRTCTVSLLMYLPDWEKYNRHHNVQILARSDAPRKYEFICIDDQLIKDQTLPKGSKTVGIRLMDDYNTVIERCRQWDNNVVILQMKNNHIHNAYTLCIDDAEIFTITEEDYFNHQVTVRDVHGRTFPLTIKDRQQKRWLEEMQKNAIGTQMQIRHKGVRVTDGLLSSPKIINVGLRVW